MVQFTIQCFDHDEGTAARWYERKDSRHETREAARNHLKRIRAAEGEDSMLSYRITEVGSREFFSQPTDALEY